MANTLNAVNAVHAENIVNAANDFDCTQHGTLFQPPMIFHRWSGKPWISYLKVDGGCSCLEGHRKGSQNVRLVPERFQKHSPEYYEEGNV